MKKIHFIVLIMLVLISCRSHTKLETVAELDINKYAGKWYEIAKLPNKFEKGLHCVSATYSVKENGKITVVNQGFNFTKKQWKDISGTAWIPNAKYPGQLKVRFFWPFAGNYYIIALADDYSYALVGDPSRKYLWILARDQVIEPTVYSKLINIAKDKGFDVSLVEKVSLDCDQD